MKPGFIMARSELEGLLTLDPAERKSAAEMLEHPWLKTGTRYCSVCVSLLSINSHLPSPIHQIGGLLPFVFLQVTRPRASE